PEPEDANRFPFQRDRGRIIHTQAFRRLQGKTQVFVAGEGDHYRTRLTHTMEVAQLSRDIARTLSLNEDLAECIALAHDLGHPPFAHMGEMALDAWMKKQGSHFEHNEQSLRVVTMIEEHSDGSPGLNLNREVLEGLQKHGSERLGLEAQVANIADEIAYSAHDCDDGIAAGLLTPEELSAVPLAQRARVIAEKRGTSLRGALIELLVTDLYATSTDSRIGFSDAMQGELQSLKNFLLQHMYNHPRVREASTEGQQIILRLCDTLFAQPTDKVLALQKRTGSSLPEAVKDYVSGMTDTYARAML
ncbi:dNTP triphosphohydrolase, partial [Candidatus Peribacteria bacterium]|nr:dNTP triphosphohydrolase [Candidatus Peribacteria bacterium]